MNIRTVVAATAVAALAGMAGAQDQGLDAHPRGLSDAEFAVSLALPSAPSLPVKAIAATIVPTSGAETVVRDQTTTVRVALNAQTVKCSAADYSIPMLKVLVPALAELTVLNHRNTSEGAPCIAAGRCGEGLGPQDILRSGEGIDQVPVRVVLKKIAAIDGNVCHVSLVETVKTQIRGVRFFHERTQDVADRAAADCR